MVMIAKRFAREGAPAGPAAVVENDSDALCVIA